MSYNASEFFMVYTKTLGVKIHATENRSASSNKIHLN